MVDVLGLDCKVQD